ncbi:RNA binding-protein [Aureococcus anophagefferens]|nr:RNA binding-protein [Aureococcus anophagefferens]
MGEIEDLRAELAAQQEQQELLKLKEELAKIKRENAALETKAGGAGGTPATPRRRRRRRTAASRRRTPSPTTPTCGAPTSAACPSSTEASVSSYFANACGEVRRVDLKDFDDTPGKFCGIAFVTGDEDALQRALNLDGSAYEDDERCRLKGCAVANLRYHTDADTGNFRGFCHVEFEDEASLEAALACAGTKWRGRDLRISHSETAKKRPAEGKGRQGRPGPRRRREAAAARRG